MLYVQFETPRNSITGPKLGPFEFVQLTYSEVRVGPNGYEIAYFNKNEEWTLLETGMAYSDVIIAEATCSE